MCEYCEEEKIIFSKVHVDDWLLSWGGEITTQSATYSKYITFIDRGFLRYVDIDDCDCLDHGRNIKINYCPLCGRKL